MDSPYSSSPALSRTTGRPAQEEHLVSLKDTPPTSPTIGPTPSRPYCSARPLRSLPRPQGVKPGWGKSMIRVHVLALAISLWPVSYRCPGYVRDPADVRARTRSVPPRQNLGIAQ